MKTGGTYGRRYIIENHKSCETPHENWMRTGPIYARKINDSICGTSLKMGYDIEKKVLRELLMPDTNTVRGLFLNADYQEALMKNQLNYDLAVMRMKSREFMLFFDTRFNTFT